METQKANLKPSQYEFDSYENYYGRHIFRTSCKVTFVGLVFLTLYIALFGAMKGFDARFFSLFFRYATALAFLGCMVFFLRKPRVTNRAVAGVIISGNLAMLFFIWDKTAERTPLYGIFYIIIIFMFGVIVIAPILQMRIFLTGNILANIIIVLMLRSNSYSRNDVGNFLYISLTLSVFLTAIIYYQKKEYCKAYAIAVENWTLSTTDMLSGLLNRRAWTDRSKRLFACRPDGLCFIMIDIDFFKKVNDTWGHGCGDAVIQSVAEIIRKNIREGDLAGRLGGEEFGVFCSPSTYDEARDIAERLRQRIEGNDVLYDNNRLRVTVSIGLTVGPGSSFDDLVKQGDDCLYAAKRCGRNRVVDNVRPAIPVGIDLPLQVLWSDDFSSGIGKIDAEHKALLDGINELFLLKLQGTQDDDVCGQVAKLVEKVAGHFSSEEEVLRSLGYAELNDHMKKHEEALSMANALPEKMRLRHVTVTDALYTLYKEIVMGHMLVEDRKFFYLSRQEKE